MYALLVEGLLEGVTRLADRLGFEIAVLGGDIVTTAVTGPPSDDGRAGVYPDRGRAERERAVVAFRADLDRDL